MTAIEIRGVTKTFGRPSAVNDVSLDVPEGSIYGFIGPNGSGKTTTIRMIMNIILPDRGEIAVLGKNASAAARDDVGYLPEERGLYKKMQVRRLLRYYGQLKGRSVAELDPVIKHWLEPVATVASGPTSASTSCRKAWRRKSSSSRPIVSKPQLLILDEPFSGLDPVNAEALRDAVFELRREGTTIVFSTHDMSAARARCAIASS